MGNKLSKIKKFNGPRLLAGDSDPDDQLQQKLETAPNGFQQTGSTTRMRAKRTR